MANQKVSTQEEIESREIIEKIKAHYRKEWGLAEEKIVALEKQIADLKMELALEKVVTEILRG